MDQFFKSTLIILWSILFVFIFISHSYSTSPSRTKKNLWTASVSAGVAQLSREISNDYKFLENEFQHKPGWALDVNIGRTFGKHWEPILRGGLFNIHGESDSPDFSATGHHPALKGPIYDLPVQYKTSGGSVSGVVRYYFREFSNQNGKVFRVDPYAEAGAGANIFSTELRYQFPPPGTNSTVLFQKGVDNKETIANVVQVTFGIGTKIGNPKKWHCIVSYNADVVNYAVLDAVHNYIGWERNHAKGIISKITAGVVIPLGAASGGGSGSGNDYYPWSP